MKFKNIIAELPLIWMLIFISISIYVIVTGPLIQAGIIENSPLNILKIISYYIKSGLIVALLNSFTSIIILKEIEKENAPEELKKASKKLNKKIHIFSSHFLIEIYEKHKGKERNNHSIFSKINVFFFSKYLPSEIINYLDIPQPKVITASSTKIYALITLIIISIFSLCAMLLFTALNT